MQKARTGLPLRQALIRAHHGIDEISDAEIDREVSQTQGQNNAFVNREVRETYLSGIASYKNVLKVLEEEADLTSPLTAETRNILLQERMKRRKVRQRLSLLGTGILLLLAGLLMILPLPGSIKTMIVAETINIAVGLGTGLYITASNTRFERRQRWLLALTGLTVLILLSVLFMVVFHPLS